VCEGSGEKIKFALVPSVDLRIDAILSAAGKSRERKGSHPWISFEDWPDWKSIVGTSILGC
jgi:hypothetical protein